PVRLIRASAVPPSGPSQTNEPLPLIAFQYREDIFHDANNNVIRRLIEDRGNTAGIDSVITYSNRYDMLDDLLETSVQVSTNKSLVTRYQYDGNQNRTRIMQPGGHFVATKYDYRDQPFQVTRGADIVTDLTLTTTYHYDHNGNLSSTVDAQDT